MFEKNSHCSYCGHPFDQAQTWPRRCVNCHHTTYLNPVPVAVALVPVEQGLLTVRREVEPRKGFLALPGGFITLGESWQQAAAREVQEETGLVLDPAEIEEFAVLSAPDGTVLIFGLATRPHTQADLAAFVVNKEVSEIAIMKAPQELAFPLHTQVLQAYFERLQGQAALPSEYRQLLLSRKKLSDFFRESPLVELELDLQRDSGPLRSDIEL